MLMVDPLDHAWNDRIINWNAVVVFKNLFVSPSDCGESSEGHTSIALSVLTFVMDVSVCSE